MAHTILLVQPGGNPETRTYSDYESVNECMEGVCKIYEEHLKRRNPNTPTITYDISQLFDFVDQLSDLSCLVYQKSTNTYAPYNKDWIKEKIYILLRQAAASGSITVELLRVMGSEHSMHHSGNQRQGSYDGASPKHHNFRRQHTIANPGSNETFEAERPGSTSPGPSVCSDTDLPYISYTVNRPIGDSPKLTNKTKPKAQRKLPLKNVKKSAHNIVVVKPALSGPNVDRDPDILRLQSIPMFLPIMRATLNLPAARDPEVLERLDPVPLQRMCSRYQNHLHSCANTIATEQNVLTQRIREIDSETGKLVAVAVERQKSYAKNYEKLKRIHEVSHQLNRCHSLLNLTLESMETLNNLLDIEDRLEPFIWTTG